MAFCGSDLKVLLWRLDASWCWTVTRKHAVFVTRQQFYFSYSASRLGETIIGICGKSKGETWGSHDLKNLYSIPQAWIVCVDDLKIISAGIYGSSSNNRYIGCQNMIIQRELFIFVYIACATKYLFIYKLSCATKCCIKYSLLCYEKLFVSLAAGWVRINHPKDVYLTEFQVSVQNGFFKELWFLRTIQ